MIGVLEEKTFLTQSISRIDDGLARDDWEQIEKAAHKLKGSFG
jgi:HPt (histidine-containing phosphotransfer) domain-containing protein